MIKAKAPGKLYIAGEYAVVETGYPAIIVALNQFVTVTIKESQTYGSIVSKQYSENSIYWRRRGNQMVFDNRDNPFHYILSAIDLVEEYAREQGKELGLYHLQVNSDLDSEDGKKYGLGSSAAVTVATVDALCQYYELNISRDILFKLAAIAHLEVQGNGSLGDIAASVYGGWIAYHSFDREWLLMQRQQSVSLTTLVDVDWPNLEVELLQPPSELKLLIGWTGSPASTSILVDQTNDAKVLSQVAYQKFLDGSRECLEKMILAFKEQDLDQIQKRICQNRRLLQDLAAFSGVIIETPLLKELCDIAEKNAGAAKSSGAGGGDCGIALFGRNEGITQLIEAWQSVGISTLPLEVHHI